VSQLDPGRPAAVLKTDQVGILQLLDDLVLQLAAGGIAFQHLAAHAQTGDQLVAKPIADFPLGHARLGSHRGNPLSVIFRQRLVYVTDPL
jgi:hypothetical protein